MLVIRRNFYLTGSTLFLALSLNRVYSLLLDTIKLQDELAHARAQVSFWICKALVAGLNVPIVLLEVHRGHRC